jgi:hypothetical protein
MVISTGSPAPWLDIVFGVCPKSFSDNVPILLVSIEVQVDFINAKWMLRGFNMSNLVLFEYSQ